MIEDKLTHRVPTKLKIKEMNAIPNITDKEGIIHHTEKKTPRMNLTIEIIDEYT